MNAASFVELIVGAWLGTVLVLCIVGLYLMHWAHED